MVMGSYPPIVAMANSKEFILYKSCSLRKVEVLTHAAAAVPQHEGGKRHKIVINIGFSCKLSAPPHSCYPIPNTQVLRSDPPIPAIDRVFATGTQGESQTR